MVQYGLYLGAVQRGRFLIIEPIENSSRVIIADDRLLDWIAERIPHVGSSAHWQGRARAIGVGDGANILAAMAIYAMDPRGWNAEVAIAADSANWATRGVLRKFLAYPFEQLGLRRITAVCAASNVRAIKFNLRLGFKREGLMPFAASGDDAVIMGMLREDAERWLQSSEPSDTNGAYSMAATA